MEVFLIVVFWEIGRHTLLGGYGKEAEKGG